ncbi:MAG: hypothetical protein KDB14_22825 [Planctomycetales bacterium]|nr:hypothetical protein [Planctomycetales bacterium]
MAKYYVESGPVQLVLAAESPLAAAVKAFQWTCDRQAEILAESPLDHVQQADELGVQFDDVVFVNERGFGRFEAVWHAETVDILEAWMANHPL